ncbi:hypothetical protein PHMEG_0004363 [Phytophthora megakarya]|uniref:PH domain-containing protein n=1 Tax=Phytophthora megakarya TaxID=4795 RepID=A0A225WU21_9STRA|nr:hypothetical protein PHMEG_0004363 [Phytophthora megakarya]
MTCGQLYVQSILSTVYIVCTTQPKPAGIERSKHATLNLVIQRPRVAGKMVTIPLDATVKVATGSSKDAEHNIIRLNYGLSSKKIAVRASSSQERDQWLFKITTALSISQVSVPPRSNESMKMGSYMSPRKSHPNRSKKPSQGRNVVPKVSNSVSATKMQHSISFVAQLTQVPRTTHSAPAHYSLRRMVRQNIPAAMQFVITVGQIIASVS